MHEGEIRTDVGLVGRLLAAQFPPWASLPIQRVASAGTDNALYRLGSELVVRLPRIHWAVGQVALEHRWLPGFAPLLPLTIPAPLAMGTPGEGYPYPWSVYRWLDGENATFERLSDPCQAAVALAEFIRALQKIDTTGAPLSGRGMPLAERDTQVREAIAALGTRVDTKAVTVAWERARGAPAWEGPPLWSHGDLHTGNLLIVKGALSAVIDFGCLGVGDPACELIVAWNLFTGRSRNAFREALNVEDALWERGRGWALSVALIALPYYWETNPKIVQQSLRTLDQLLTR